MRSKWIIVLCALFAVQDAIACGMTSKLVPLELEAGIKSVQVAASELPEPVVVVTEIVRGIGPKHSSCDDTGLLTLMVEWPRGKHKLRDIGFEFKVVAGQTPYPIFPEGPMQAPSNGRKSDFLFMWREGAPAQQKPIELQVEVRAVARDNQRGPPARILIRAAPGG